MTDDRSIIRKLLLRGSKTSQKLQISQIMGVGGEEPEMDSVDRY